MAALPPAVAATRTAVRNAVRRLSVAEGSLVLTACSGGADSLALAAAAAFILPRMGLRAGLATVDHRLQPGSGDRAADLVAWAATAGLDPAIVRPVDATPHGEGPEAAARSARYRALAEIGREQRAAAVLLGHTRDDQAETVLLALARGSGPRGIAGMPGQREIDGIRFVRPFLEVTRAQTETACAELGLKPWSDPHNEDPSYARSRLRAAMSTLVATLGPDVVTNLARTARLIAADADLLDRLAAEAEASVTSDAGEMSITRLAELPAALRTRVLRRFALRAGALPSALSAVHVDALDALVVAWHGQGPVALPGGAQVVRQGDRMLTGRDVL